ncbi:MAG: EamA family transporter [Spirochaetota bacterium]
MPCALTGILLVVNPLTFTVRSDFGAGVMLGFAVSFFYAGYILLLRRAKRIIPDMSSFCTMFLVSAFCALFFFAETAVTGVSLALPGMREAVLLAAYGILGQGIAWVLITENMPHVQASYAGLLLLLQPALSYVWDILFFSRMITAAESAGVVIALAAVYLGTVSRD